MIPLPYPLTRRRLLGAALAAGATATFGPPRAALASLAPPSGRIILTVSGGVGVTNAEAAAAFDLAMLDALPQRDTITATPWHEGRPRFSGPTVASVLDAAGASGTMLRIVALNDYAAEMPMDDARSIPVILATRIDGKEIAVRDKGPIFVIYPFDERPDLFNEVYFGRSVWQVSRIEVMA